MAPVQISIVLVALVTLAVSEEDNLLLQLRPKDFAEESARVATVKAGIMEKTEDLAKAMKNLNADDVESMRKDFEDVLAMYQEDLEQDIGKLSGTEVHASVAEESEGLDAKKAGIMASTKKLAEAMKHLNADDVESMRKDFEEVFAMYRNDVEENSRKPSGTKEHASLSDGSKGTHPKKESIMEKTKKLSEAMKDLRNDFEDVFAIYNGATEDHASLAEGSQGIDPEKASVLAETKKLVEAMKDFNADFEDVFAMDLGDLDEDIEGPSGTQEHASLAEGSQGLDEFIDAKKASIRAKTDKVSEAMNNLRKDWEEWFKQDLMDTGSRGERELASLAEDPADSDPMKESIMTKTKKLAEAMTDLRKDFEDAFARFQGDREKDIGQRTNATANYTSDTVRQRTNATANYTSDTVSDTVNDTDLIE